MFGFSSSEFVLVALIVGLVLVAGRAGAWGEALALRFGRGRGAGGPGAGRALPGRPGGEE